MLNAGNNASSNESELMDMKEFLSHCIACGGNWTQMIATGIKKLWPEEYAKLPETFNWKEVIDVLKRKGVKME